MTVSEFQKTSPGYHLKLSSDHILSTGKSGATANWIERNQPITFIFIIAGRGILFCRVQEDESLSLLWFMLDIQPEEGSISNQDVESRLISNFNENHQAVNSDSRGILLFFIGKLCTAPENENRQTENPGNKTHSIFQNILNLINSDIERRISVPELAETCGMSPRSIQYLFKRTLGITLTEYIAEIKANHAARALLRGVRVQQAGETIGIPDPAQFSRFFKKHFGIPPVKYRQMSLEQLNFFSTTFEDTGFRKFV